MTDEMTTDYDDDAPEFLSFASWLADEDIEPKAFEMDARTLLPLWDVHGRDYIRFCRASGLEYETLPD